jgi:adenine-specific DNA-methyltransferase
MTDSLIEPDAWASLYRDLSQPSERPESGRIAVKVINHYGNEVLRV